MANSMRTPGPASPSTEESIEAAETLIERSPKMAVIFQELRDASQDPLHLAFLVRAMQALTDLTAQLDDDHIGEATSSSSDLEVLLTALSATPELPLDEGDSMWLRARLRAIRQKRELLNAEGGTASSSELGELLELTRQAVDKRRKQNKLLALKAGGRGYRYPIWQVVDGKALFGLQQVLETLTHHDPWMTLQFFLRPNSRLDEKRPLDVLRDKSSEELRRVVASAKAYGEHGAD